MPNVDDPKSTPVRLWNSTIEVMDKVLADGIRVGPDQRQPVNRQQLIEWLMADAVASTEAASN